MNEHFSFPASGIVILEDALDKLARLLGSDFRHMGDPRQIKSYVEIKSDHDTYIRIYVRQFSDEPIDGSIRLVARYDGQESRLTLKNASQNWYVQSGDQSGVVDAQGVVQVYLAWIKGMPKELQTQLLEEMRASKAPKSMTSRPRSASGMPL